MTARFYSAPTCTPVPTILDTVEHELDSSLVFVLVPDGHTHAQWGPVVDGFPEIAGDWLYVDTLDDSYFYEDIAAWSPERWREWARTKRRSIQVQSTCNVCEEDVTTWVQPEDDAPPVYHREDGSHGVLWALQVKGAFAPANERSPWECV